MCTERTMAGLKTQFILIESGSIGEKIFLSTKGCKKFSIRKGIFVLGKEVYRA
jgi:hypothetical protein